MTRIILAAISLLSLGVAIASVGYTAWRFSQPSSLFAMSMRNVSMRPEGSNCAVTGTITDLVRFVDRPLRSPANIAPDGDYTPFFDLWTPGETFEKDPPNAAVRTNGYTIVEIRSVIPLNASAATFILSGASGQDLNYCNSQIRTLEFFVDSICGTIGHQTGFQKFLCGSAN